MTSADWRELVETAGSRPLWDGTLRAIDSDEMLVWFWWQVWDTARMDMGFSAHKGLEADQRALQAIERAVNQMLDGVISGMILPSLIGTYDWDLERKAAKQEVMTKGRTGKAHVRVSGRVILRVPEGRWLNECMNAVKRFAEDMGWTEKV